MRHDLLRQSRHASLFADILTAGAAYGLFCRKGGAEQGNRQVASQGAAGPAAVNTNARFECD